VQLIPQDPTTTLPPTTRILDIVARPAARLRNLDNPNARRYAHILLEAVDLPTGLHRRRPATLSGGERQRVTIARALAAQPDLLICDEITSALDPANTDRLIELLAELREAHKLTLLVITHDPDVATRLADRTINLSAPEPWDQTRAASG
jgi:ABC-type dipeptide/oligopeptide/nickel transport system ATPase subunit